jgi:hypothetical protein
VEIDRRDCKSETLTSSRHNPSLVIEFDQIEARCIEHGIMCFEIQGKISWW